LGVKEMIKQLTAEEIATLKTEKPQGRKKWVVRRFGTKAEKATEARFGKCPAWADSVVNQINWEDK